jgi:UTP--glucose-1-phosphate uridylyltransferase
MYFGRLVRNVFQQNMSYPRVANTLMASKDLTYMTTRIDKAVITAAGPGQNTLPLQRLVDRDGVEKSALELIIEEVDAAGIEKIGLVIRDGDQEAYRHAAGRLVDRLHFMVQREPRGYGDALLCSESFAAGDNILHLVGDHIFLSYSNRRCSQQLLEIAREEGCCVSAVQPTRETMLPYFGAVAGQRLPGHDSLFEVKVVMEKPTPTQAEQYLTNAGFRSGTYLCFFGMHVLTAGVYEALNQLAASSNRSIPLAEALNVIASRERYLALQIDGHRHNIGMKYGLLQTQLALGLSGVDRDAILREIVEVMAMQSMATAE